MYEEFSFFFQSGRMPLAVRVIIYENLNSVEMVIPICYERMWQIQ